MRKLLTLLLALSMAMAAPAAAFAEERNYDVYDAEWEDSSATQGKVYGVWNVEDRANYKVSLYKDGKLVLKEDVIGTRINFSRGITSKKGGTGTYTFTVEPDRDGKPAESDELEVTSEMVTKLRAQLQKDNKEQIVANGAGWVSGPGGIWIYYDQNGNQLKSQWVTSGGYKYYLDKDGKMVTGWQTISNAWYYFEPSSGAERPQGACYVDTVTPDGYTVNADGAWVRPVSTAASGQSGTGGSAQSGTQGSAQTVAVAKSLAAITISLQEDSQPGSYTRIRNITAGSGTVSNIAYKTDQSGWTSTSPGTVTFDVTVNDSVLITGNTKVSCSRASSVSIISRSGQTARIELHYIPKYIMAQPSGFYMTPEWVLKWIPVQKASSYTVKAVIVEEDAEGTAKNTTLTVSVTEPEFNLNGNGITEDTEVKSLTVQAVGGSKKTTTDSAAAAVGDLKTLAEEKTVNGEFKYSSSGVSYRDEYGEQVTGWKEIAGSWFFFKKNGYAAGPGWYQDTDGNWYYFDSAYRMVTGTVSENGTDYILNDGSNPAFPKGAWIH